MYAVAIAELAQSPGPLGALATQLAMQLGTTRYELELALNAGLPAVVLLTVDAEAAAKASRAIEAQGHR